MCRSERQQNDLVCSVQLTVAVRSAVNIRSTLAQGCHPHPPPPKKPHKVNQFHTHCEELASVANQQNVTTGMCRTERPMAIHDLVKNITLLCETDTERMITLFSRVSCIAFKMIQSYSTANCFAPKIG